MDKKTPTQQAYIDRAVALALLFMMQTGFTLYGFFVLLTIKAAVWLWGYWIVYQIIGWIWFLWQFRMTNSNGRRIKELEDENEELKARKNA